MRLPLVFAFLGTVVQSKTPHLVLFVIDDLGWGDVGYHGSAFPTPNIDNLATQGVQLDRFYTNPTCTPTRSALMSGRHPHKTGMQFRENLHPRTPWHLPLNATTVAEALGKVGYRCHCIGKWHLGMASWKYTPLGRGFESHAGFFQGGIDYYSHRSDLPVLTTHSMPDLFPDTGHDFWRNKTQAWEQDGRYSTDFYMEEAQHVLDNHNPEEPLFLYFASQLAHTPLEFPPEDIYHSNCAQISNTSQIARHAMCTMISRLDKSIGDMVEMLKGKGIWEDTLMWVTSDNGGMNTLSGITSYFHEISAASNYPLRAGKSTLFEGGVRAVNFVTGGLSGITAAAGSVRSELVQHVDIPTTLAAIAGANLGEDIDGFDVWNVIVAGHQSPRTELPLNLDLVPTNHSALIQGKWKLINSQADFLSNMDGWWSSETTSRTFPNSSQIPVDIDGWKVMLFDIVADPQELKNVAVANPEIVRKMLQRINELIDPSNGYRPAQKDKLDKHGDPTLRSGSYWGTFAPWLDRDDQGDLPFPGMDKSERKKDVSSDSFANSTAVTPVMLFM